jgi:hypothetical protein
MEKQGAFRLFWQYAIHCDSIATEKCNLATKVQRS